MLKKLVCCPAFALAIAIGFSSCGRNEPSQAPPTVVVSPEPPPQPKDAPAPAARENAGKADETVAPKQERAADAKPLTADEVLRDMLTAWNRVQKVSAKMAINAKRNVGDKGYSEGKGAFVFERQGDGFRAHYSVRNMVLFEVDGEEGRYFTPEQMEFVTDGKVLEHLTVQRGLRQLVRKRYDPSAMLQFGGRALIDPLREACRFQSVTRADWEGRKAVMLECKYKEREGSSNHAFDLESGIRLGWIERDAEGEEILSVRINELDLNPTFDEASFVMPQAVNYTLIDETGPERKVIPWEELSKGFMPVPPPEAPAPTEGSDAASTSEEASAAPQSDEKPTASEQSKKDPG